MDWEYVAYIVSLMRRQVYSTVVLLGDLLTYRELGGWVPFTSAKGAGINGVDYDSNLIHEGHEATRGEGSLHKLGVLRGSMIS